MNRLIYSMILISKKVLKKCSNKAFGIAHESNQVWGDKTASESDFGWKNIFLVENGFHPTHDSGYHWMMWSRNFYGFSDLSFSSIVKIVWFQNARKYWYLHGSWTFPSKMSSSSPVKYRLELFKVSFFNFITQE